eukprot:superscaffoldBa00004630_g19207
MTQELRLDHCHFQRYLKPTRVQFDDLLVRIDARISQMDTNRVVSAADRLSICLYVVYEGRFHNWYVTTGDSFRTVANSFCIGVSTVSKIVPDLLVKRFNLVPSNCLLTCHHQELTTDDSTHMSLLLMRALHSGKNLMKPFSWRVPLRECRIFNYHLSRAQLVVENVSGILYSQWRMYRGAIEVHPELVEKCVKVTCVLHNLLWRTTQQLSKRGHQV